MAVAAALAWLPIGIDYKKQFLTAAWRPYNLNDIHFVATVHFSCLFENAAAETIWLAPPARALPIGSRP
jgi:hypothetical protein